MLDFIPNQKVVKINREKVDKGTGSGRNYLIAYQDNISAASIALSHTGFKVYIYLLFNKDQFRIAFSPEHIHQVMGICNESARRAFKELLEKGYIEQNDKSFSFYEYPQRKPNIKPIGEKREFVDSETGEVFVYSYNQLVAALGEEQAAALWESDSNVGE